MCEPKTLSALIRWQNRLSWRNDWAAVFIPCFHGRTIQVEEHERSWSPDLIDRHSVKIAADCKFGLNVTNETLGHEGIRSLL